MKYPKKISFLVDTKEKSITRDEELKKVIAESRPHDQWWKELVTLDDLRKSSIQIPEVKFIFSRKATKIEKVSTIDLTFTT